MNQTAGQTSQPPTRRKTHHCPICGKEKRAMEVLHRELVHGPVLELIRRKHPDLSAHDVICLSCLNRFRAEYVEDVLETEKGELTQIEEEVIRSLQEHEVLSTDINRQFERQLTLGERLADRIAEFGGSWTFIILFGAFLGLWMGVNSFFLLRGPFDPFPYILLNLVLSTLAAIQAPVIMMSQNRQEDKDRLRAENDYRVNLKAELQIRHLNAKMDQLLTHQWRRLLEIQQIQMHLMEELVRKPQRGPAG